MFSHVSVTPLCLLNDHLRVKNYPQAANKQTTHQVAQTKHAARGKEPPDQIVEKHYLHHGHDNAAQE